MAVVAAALGLTLGSGIHGSQGSGSTDRAATEVYLRSRYTLEQERAAGLAEGMKTVDGLVASLARECPGVMTGAPHDEQSETLAQERLVILALALPRSPIGPSKTYAHIVGRIHWSNDKLTRLVRAWLSAEAAEGNLVPPDPCVDMRAWVTSGYHRLSASTTGFLERSDAIDNRTRAEKREMRVPPATRTGKVILELLGPYESSKDRAIALRLKHLEAELFVSELAIVASGASRLSHALGAGGSPRSVFG